MKREAETRLADDQEGGYIIGLTLLERMFLADSCITHGGKRADSLLE